VVRKFWRVSETGLSAREGRKNLRASRKDKTREAKKNTSTCHIYFIINNLTKKEPKTKPNFSAALARCLRADWHGGGDPSPVSSRRCGTPSAWRERVERVRCFLQPAQDE
jgi:hypothetical protein